LPIVQQARRAWPPSPLNSTRLVARLLAHDVQVVGDGFRQVDDGAGDERLGAVKAWHG
jgi:hypothetical protein